MRIPVSNTRKAASFPARLIRWDEAAFEDSPCAADYLRLRNTKC